MLKPCKNLGKTVVFAHAEFFRVPRVPVRQNIEKRGFGPPQIVPGRFKILPGAARIVKKTNTMSQKHPTSAQETAKIEKKAPKSEKCANMTPTWRNFGLLALRPGLP